MRLRRANPASPSIIDVTAPTQPEPFTLEQQHRADSVLRGIEVQVFIGQASDDAIVSDAVARLRS